LLRASPDALAGTPATLRQRMLNGTSPRKLEWRYGREKTEDSIGV
jgi:hypothetical protein